MAASSCWSTTRSNTACGRPSPKFRPAGRWFTAKRTVLRVWNTSNRIGLIYGRRVCAKGWQRAGGPDRLTVRLGGWTEFGDRALPVTRGQLDIWLAQETGHSGAEWQLGLFVKIEGFVERDALDWAISRVVREAEPVRAAFSESDGRVLQSAIDYPDVALDFFDLSGSRHPVQEAREMASSIQRMSMQLTGQLFKFLLFQTRADEFHLFACCHHIVIDGFGLALLCQRIASVYSTIVSGAPIAPSIFGSFQDLLDCESEYEASKDYLDDQAYWTANLPAISEPHYRLAER